MKSVCIKTNNQKFKNYLLEKFNSIELDSIYFSCLKFKVYDNIIIHYLGPNSDIFLQELSCILTSSVIKFYERPIIAKMLSDNYFYFSTSERKQIFEECSNELENANDFVKFNTIKNSIYQYLSTNKTLIPEGFIAFRLNEYLSFLDSIIDISVNKFIIEREYTQFIELLRDYINSRPANINLIHLIYEKKNSKIFDEFKNVIEPNKDSFNTPYVSDISFSSNDYALNTLLTIIPQKLIIHTLEENDEFICTLKLIFEKRVEILKECNF